MDRTRAARTTPCIMFLLVVLLAGSGTVPGLVNAEDYTKFNNKKKRQYLSEAQIQKLPPAVKSLKKTYARGDRVITLTWAGTCKIDEAGYIDEIMCNEGHAGTILGSINSDNNGVAIVRWDRQVWKPIKFKSKPVMLDEFDAAIHIDYLGPGPAKAEK